MLSMSCYGMSKLWWIQRTVRHRLLMSWFHQKKTEVWKTGKSEFKNLVLSIQNLMVRPWSGFMLTQSLGVVLMTNHQENISVYKDKIKWRWRLQRFIPIIWSIARPTFVNHGFPIDLIKHAILECFILMVFSFWFWLFYSPFIGIRENVSPLKDNI